MARRSRMVRSLAVSPPEVYSNESGFAVKFDAGPSWSGLMPISNHPNETRKLFFW